MSIGSRTLEGPFFSITDPGTVLMKGAGIGPILIMARGRMWPLPRFPMCWRECRTMARCRRDTTVSPTGTWKGTGLSGSALGTGIGTKGGGKGMIRVTEEAARITREDAPGTRGLKAEEGDG
jgi:hypothetical protein